MNFFEIDAFVNLYFEQLIFKVERWECFSTDALANSTTPSHSVKHLNAATFSNSTGWAFKLGSSNCIPVFLGDRLVSLKQILENDHCRLGLMSGFRTERGDGLNKAE